ncbi:MAG: hypothetical protein ABR884_03845 [Minisyncoccia bacterium]|jgi:hypothetical protein
MTKSKIPTVVTSALRKHILPAYLKNLFWKTAGNNPLKYWRDRKTYFVAIYYLASICSLNCLERDSSGNRIFKAGFPESLEVLKEKVDVGIVEVASEVLAFQEMSDPVAASDVRLELKMAFNAAKLFKLIAEEATYGLYFRRAKNVVAVTKAEIFEDRHERFM